MDTEKERIESLLNKIYELRKHSLMEIDRLLKRMDELDSEIETLRNAILAAPDKLTVTKISAALKSCTTQKLLCSERRHLIRKLAIDEAKLMAELMRLGYEK